MCSTPQFRARWTVVCLPFAELGSAMRSTPQNCVTVVCLTFAELGSAMCRTPQNRITVDCGVGLRDARRAQIVLIHKKEEIKNQNSNYSKLTFKGTTFEPLLRKVGGREGVDNQPPFKSIIML